MGLFGGENSGLLQALVFGVLEIFLFLFYLKPLYGVQSLTVCLSVYLPIYRN